MSILLFALLVQGTVVMAEDSGNEPADSVRFEKTGFQECLGEMEGHTTPEAELKICQVGNGTYLDHKGVLQVLRTKDWFPFSKFSTLVGEVRVTCAPDAAVLKRQVVFPARSEQGKRARIELPCGLAAKAAGQAMAAVQTLLLSGLKDRAKFAGLAAEALPGCKAKPKLDSCVRYATLVKDTVAGVGAAEVNGRPFSFTVAGFEFRAGLEPAPKKINDDVNSPDPIVRMRAYMRLKDEMDDREWRDQTRAIFDNLGPEAQRQLVEEAVENADAQVRNWGMDNASLLKEERLLVVMARALDDSDSGVRSKAIPFAFQLGEPFMVRALNDPMLGNRELAYDTLIATKGDKARIEQMVRLLERGLGDPDASIRELAKSKLNMIREDAPPEDVTPKEP